MKNQNGQVLILLLVFLPTLLLIFGLLVRSGKTTLVHDQVENHCNRKILDALAIEAQGLQKIGELNPYSRIVIQARRIVDALIVASAYYVIAEPALISMQKSLIQSQRLLEKMQKAIKVTTSLLFLEKLQTRAPALFRGKIIESYRPMPLKNFYLKADEGFDGEVGPPLEPDDSFKTKAFASGKIKILTEKFLWKWNNLEESKNMLLECKAQIQIERLEEKWSVQLVPAAKRSLSLPL